MKAHAPKSRTMNVLAIIHHQVAPCGVFADEVRSRGHELDLWIPSDGALPQPLRHYGAVMTFGGGMQVDQEDRFPWLLAELDVLARRSCGAFRRSASVWGLRCSRGPPAERSGRPRKPECGWMEVQLTDEGAEDPLLGGLPRRSTSTSGIRIRSSFLPGRCCSRAARSACSASASASARGVSNGIPR